MTLNRSSRNFVDFHPLRYISISAIVIGYIAFTIPNASLAEALGPSVLPTCSTASGTITSISGQKLQITHEQGGPIVNATYSNATDIVKEEVVTNSALKKGMGVQVLTTKTAELVMLDPSDQPSEASSLGCQLSHPTSQTTQRSPSTSTGGSQMSVSQGTIQQITDNTFTLLPHAGLPKTFTWATNTTFIQYTDHQSSQILSSGVPVLLIGPMNNGVLMASRITVIPKMQSMAFMDRCDLPILSCPPIPDFIALALLALVFS